MTLRCTCLLYLLPHACIGCRYERIEQNTKNAMRRQKAELLVSLEVLMSDEDRNKYFPRWIFWYRPAERQDEDTSDENGVINGVQRMLAQQSKEQQGMLDQQSKDQAVQIANLTQELGEMSAKFDLLLAAVAQQVPAPEPEVTPSRDTA